MKKQLSIMQRLKIRMGFSIIYLLTTCFFFKRIYDIGRINNIGILNGIIMFICISIAMIMLACSMESIHSYSDPINRINKRTYRVIFCVQIILMIFCSWLVYENNINNLKKFIFYCIYFFMTVLIISMHWNIIERYKKMSKESVDDMIETYKMIYNAALLEKSEEVKKRAYYFIVYLILIGVFFKYFLMNTIATIAFIVLNLVVVIKMFKHAFENFYQEQSKEKPSGKILCIENIVLIIGYIFLYLVFQEKIKIRILEGRTPDELAMLYMLFYIPLYRHIINVYIVGVRMTQQWSR